MFEEAFCVLCMCNAFVFFIFDQVVSYTNTQIHKMDTKIHRIDKRKSFVFLRQYRNCFSLKIIALLPRNQPIKAVVGMVMLDFYVLKTMTLHHVADIAYF